MIWEESREHQPGHSLLCPVRHDQQHVSYRHLAANIRRPHTNPGTVNFPPLDGKAPGFAKPLKEIHDELARTMRKPERTSSKRSSRFVFLDPRAEASYGDWDRVATESVAILRSAAGRDPHNRDLSDLVGELATQSEAFRTRWAAHNVRFHNTGTKHFNHPDVGELHLSYNRLDLAADPGLTLFTYTAEPGSRSEDALKLLGSLAATVDQAASAHTTDQS